jgi:hypothetical protein
MQPDLKHPQQNSIAATADIEAPRPKQTSVQATEPTENPSHQQVVISERQQHIPWLSAHLKPRQQVYFDEAAHGYVIKHSRPHRKNRYAEFSPDEKHWQHLAVIPKWPQVFRLDFNNISWHVAVWFTLGSIAWVVNGQYAMWPRQGDSDLQVNVNLTGYSALAGGLLFWIGAYLSIVEALNEKENMNYGIELRHVLDKLEEEPRDIQQFIRNKMKLHHQNIKAGTLPTTGNGHISGKGGVAEHHGACHVVYTDDKDKISNPKESIATSDANSTNGTSNGSENNSKKENVDRLKKSVKKWRWWGTETSSIGWWASIIQFTGATAFTVSVITGTPGVLADSQWQVETALSWTMQVIGSLGFIISSLILMLEEQREWYIPALDRIGWHSAFWNLIGSIGFLLSAVFGYLADWGGHGEVCCQFWGTAFNTYYGSWGFLISSVLLLIEVENKEPTRFDHVVARAAAWVAIRTTCDSKQLREEEEESSETSQKRERSAREDI